MISAMKNHLIPLLALGLWSLPPAIAAQATTTAPAPVVNLQERDNLEELARSYARAFTFLKTTPVHIALQREGRTTVLNDIKKLTNAGSVLVVENGKGLIYLINPRDVFWISDSPAPKEP